MSTITTEPADTTVPRVSAAARSRARKVLALAIDEARIAPERTAAWLRLTRYAEVAGTSLEIFLAVYVLPWREGESSEQRLAEADRLAAMAGEAIGERDVAMLRAEAGVHDAVAAVQRARREQEWSKTMSRAMVTEALLGAARKN